MSFSNTVSQTTFNTRRVIDSAVRRCKVPAQAITAEHIDIAKDQLYLLLSNLANLNVPLWCIEKQIYPLYDGVGEIATDLGTVDILNANLRWLQPLTGTDTSAPTTYTTEFDSATLVSTLGIKWSATAVDISIQRSDDGVTWTTVQSETVTASAGDWTWFDLDSAVASLYIRVSCSSGTLGIDALYLGNTPTEIPLSRMNRDDYTNLPNKVFQSNRPLQYWFDRQVRQPVMHLWPVPNASAETSQIVVWRHRQIMDVGTLTQEIEVPQRWYEAIVAGLSAKLALELTEVDPQMIPLLDGKAASALYEAQNAERDNSPIRMAPNISAYTR